MSLEYDEYLFVFVRQTEVGLHVGLHSSEQVRIYGVPQHTCALKRRLDLKINNSSVFLAQTNCLEKEKQHPLHCVKPSNTHTCHCVSWGTDGRLAPHPPSIITSPSCCCPSQQHEPLNIDQSAVGPRGQRPPLLSLPLVSSTGSRKGAAERLSPTPHQEPCCKWPSTPYPELVLKAGWPFKH